MFDLDRAVAEWKRSLLEESPCSLGDVRELEAHLFDLMEDFRLSGLTDEEAFAMALHRIGDGACLKREFTKVHRKRLVRSTALRMSLAWLFWAGIWAVVTWQSGRFLLSLPALGVVLGGTLAILLVNFTPREIAGLGRGTFRLATLPPGQHLRAVLLWQTATRAALATGALAFFVGVVVLLSHAAGLAEIGPYLAFSLLSVIYALTLVCAVTIPAETLARKNGLDLDPARHAESRAPASPPADTPAREEEKAPVLC